MKKMAPWEGSPLLKATVLVQALNVTATSLWAEVGSGRSDVSRGLTRHTVSPGTQSALAHSQPSLNGKYHSDRREHQGRGGKRRDRWASQARMSLLSDYAETAFDSATWARRAGQDSQLVTTVRPPCSVICDTVFWSWTVILG